MVAQGCDVVKSNIFNFHSIRSVLIVNLRTKNSQKKAKMLEVKLDTGSMAILCQSGCMECCFHKLINMN